MYNLVVMDKQINIQEALDWYLWAGVDETCSDLLCLTNSEEINRPAPATAVVERTAEVKPAISVQSFAVVSKNAREICGLFPFNLLPLFRKMPVKFALKLRICRNYVILC